VVAGRKRREESRFTESARSLAALLVATRQEQGITQERLASVSGVALSTLRKIERGQTVEPGYFTIASLAKCLDLPQSRLEESVGQIVKLTIPPLA
jgi:transcriptional regulator with XRE-family HTH domain